MNALKAPLRRIVSRPTQLTEELECGHVIARPLGLGENAQEPSRVQRRRGHRCLEDAPPVPEEQRQS